MRQIRVDSYEKLKEVKGLFKEIKSRRGRMLYDLAETPFNRIIYFFPAVIEKKPEEDENLVALLFSRTSSPTNAYAGFLGFMIGKATRVPLEKEKNGSTNPKN